MRQSPWPLFWFVFVILILTSLNPLTSFAQTSQVNDGTIATSTIISLTNKDREFLGLKTLQPDSTLEKAAQMKAEDMALKSYFAHKSPEGKTPWYWFKKVGYNYKYAGENLAIKFSNPEEIEKAWMNSPTHKANIVSEKYSEIGIGIAYGEYNGEKTVFVVQLFGTESSKIVAMK